MDPKKKTTYECSCGSIFKHASSLSRHRKELKHPAKAKDIDETSTRRAPVRLCQICGKPYWSIQGYHDHFKAKHSEINQVQPQPLVLIESNDKFMHSSIQPPSSVPFLQVNHNVNVGNGIIGDGLQSLGLSDPQSRVLLEEELLDDPGNSTLVEACQVPSQTQTACNVDPHSDSGGSVKTFKCFECGKSFDRPGPFYKHGRKEKHQLSSVIRKRPTACQERDCDETFGSIKSFVSHLKQRHNMSFEEDLLEFATHQDFLAWKAETEDQTNSQFVKKCGNPAGDPETNTANKKSGNPAGDPETKTVYYYCRCSGYARRTSSSLRSRRNTPKLGFACTASIVAKTDLDSGIVAVSYIKTHYGHEPTSFSHIETGMLRLSLADKAYIADQLKAGVEAPMIMQKIRRSVGSRSKRLQMVTRKDISNISASLGLSEFKLHSDDIESVRIRIDQLKADPNNPIVLAKLPPQCSENTGEDDILIGFQTPWQRLALQTFGCRKGSTICIDSTHKTTSTDRKLVTLLVKDDFEAGIPVGFCIMSHETEANLTLFFQALKDKCGDLTPTWIMTDDFPAYFNAWVAVFGAGAKKLLCTWHVDKNWRTSVVKLIDPPDLRQKVYKTLKTLQECLSVKKFRTMLKQTVSDLLETPETEKFGLFFEKYYAKRANEWAFCFRKGAGINTNMISEASFKVLKYQYLKGCQNSRLDRLLHVLIQLENDKKWDQLIKLAKGSSGGSRLQINRRHNFASKLSVENVTITSSKTFSVRSGEQSYLVERNETRKNCTCRLRCDLCGICIHTYNCNCADAQIRNIICKHVHLVCNYIRETFPESSHPATGFDFLRAEAETDVVFQYILSDNVLYSNRKQNVVLRGKGRSNGKNTPWNKRIDPQRHSLKKKKKPRLPPKGLLKPTMLEKQRISKELGVDSFVPGTSTETVGLQEEHCYPKIALSSAGNLIHVDPTPYTPPKDTLPDSLVLGYSQPIAAPTIIGSSGADVGNSCSELGKITSTSLTNPHLGGCGSAVELERTKISRRAILGPIMLPNTTVNAGIELSKTGITSLKRPRSARVKPAVGPKGAKIPKRSIMCSRKAPNTAALDESDEESVPFIWKSPEEAAEFLISLGANIQLPLTHQIIKENRLGSFADSDPCSGKVNNELVRMNIGLKRRISSGDATVPNKRAKASCLKFSTKSPKDQAEVILSCFMLENLVKEALYLNLKIEEHMIECQPEKVNLKVTEKLIRESIDIIVPFCSEDAVSAINNVITTMRNNKHLKWFCGYCSTDLSSSTSVNCESCLSWFHTSCTGPVGSGSWFCMKCQS